MNYNEYDSNGNKNKFNLSDIINDRKQRSRFFLLVYLFIFIVLVIFIRTNLKTNPVNESKENNNSNKEENNEVVSDNNTNISEDLNEMFSFIDMKNYNFNYSVDIGETISLFEGKRYNDKYSFTASLNNDSNVLYFNGTSNYIKAKEDENGEYKLVMFPYVLVNYFDTNVLKEMINKSTLEDNVYKITTKEIGEIVKQDLINGDNINTIELIKSNNKITQINLDLSNAITSYMKDSVVTNISLKYSNFGLIDDFKIE